MTAIHGFEPVDVRDIPELKTRSYRYRHSRTGAQLLSLVNDDENKVFGITFRTPPSDSTGVAHILEHSVLCGSRKFPVKEPFVELLKGSLKTFLNAMTYPDKTCYPVASQNVKDFYHLIDVYLDAVFYPRLTPFVFQQEGWHYELEKSAGSLFYKGVVFSEMKGAYSSPESLHAELSQRSLFPDTPYGFDSGGDPDVIPSLTFEQFKAFHEKYYHPSNSRIFFYGDDDPEERLRILDDYLKGFEKREVDSTVPLQEPINRQRNVVHRFPGGSDPNPKGIVTLNWLLDEVIGTEMNVAFHMLDYVLLGMPGSPLRKALIESELGEDLAGSGLASDIRQMYFSAGLKGIDPGAADKVESLIFDVLGDLVQNGIDPGTVEAAQNTIEFTLRENNTGNYPRGLVLMLRALTTWLHDAEPLALVAFEAPLALVKKRLAENGRFFEGLIDRYFLKNLHRTRLLLEPDPELAKKADESERRRLAEVLSRMTPDQVEQTAAASARLKELQQAPDLPEALATVPTLKVSDLSRLNKTIPLSVSQEKGAVILCHELFTSGIVYLDLGLDLHCLPQRYLPYAPLFGRAFLEMGTEKEDFVTLTQRISRKTGGIKPSLLAGSVKGASVSTARLFLRGKAMVRQIEDLLSILSDVFLSVRLDNRDRFRQMVLEAKARLEHQLVPSGHQFVDLRLRALFSEADWAAEQMRGISSLLFLRDLAKAVDDDWSAVLVDLEEMRRILVNRKALLVNLTVDEKGLPQVYPQLSEFLELLPASSPGSVAWKPQAGPESEGMLIPAQVNYVGKSANLFGAGYEYHASSHVISRFLRNVWLWDKVRVQGGAYGAFCHFDRLTGIATFVSYRDPNLLKTLSVYDDSARFLKEIELSQDELEKNIIGMIGDLDQYQLPDAKGYTSMVRYLAGETDADRQIIREEIFSTRVPDFRAFGEVLGPALDRGSVKVLGSEGAIQEACSDRPGWLEVTKVL